MGIWIDPPDTAAHGRVWSHLISDSSTDELHSFAAGVGIPRRGFDGDHYDVPGQWYDAMIEAGAQPGSAADLVRKLHHAGLRLRKRKGEHGIAVVPRVVFADQGVADVDLIASSQLAIEARVFAPRSLSKTPQATSWSSSATDATSGVRREVGAKPTKRPSKRPSAKRVKKPDSCFAPRRLSRLVTSATATAPEGTCGTRPVI